MKRATWFDLLKINLFWLVINIRSNAIGVVFLPYLVDSFVQPDNKNTALGLMRTAGLVVAMLVQPAMGLLSDRSTSRFGRRRPFMLVGVLFDLLFLLLIANANSYWMLFAAVLLIQFSGNTSHGALQGLIPDQIPEEQRGAASGIKGVMELLPLILVALVVAKMVGDGQFNLAVAMTGAMMLVIALVSLLLVRETPLKQAPQTPVWQPMLRVLGMLMGIGAGAGVGLLVGGALGGLIWLGVRPWLGETSARAIAFGVGGLAAMLAAVGAGTWAGVAATLGKAALRSQRSYTWWVANRLLFFTPVTSIQVFAPYYLMNAFAIDRQQAAAMTGQLMTAVGLCTLVSALPSGWLADRWGTRRLVFISGILAALGNILLLTTIWQPSLPLLYAAGAILGIAAGLFTSANWALGTELVPQGEAGRYLGVSNLAGAGAGMIGSGFGGPIADALNTATPGLGYFVLFAIFVVMFLASSAVLNQVAAPSKPNP
jgi:MFS family permease